MRFLLSALFFLPTALFAQFLNLGVSQNGDSVDFSTRLRLRGSDHLPWPKVYRWDAASFRLIEQNPTQTGNLRGWQAIAASQSGDGRVMAVNSSSPCQRGTLCLNVSQEFTGIEVDGALLERFPAHAQVSHDGRYVLLSRNTGVGLSPGPDLRPQPGLSRYDVETGALEPIGLSPARRGRWIAADGSILRAGLQLITPSDEERDFGPDAPGLSHGVLAGDASFFVYQLQPAIFDRFASPVSELRIRFQSGEDRMLAPEGAWPWVAITSPRILYLAPVENQLQAFLMDSPAAIPVQVTFEQRGVREVAISGDGEVAFVVTGVGELLRIELAALSRREVIAATPALRIPVLEPFFNRSAHIEPPLAPGSTYRLPVANLETGIEVAEPPLPEQIRGIRVKVAGTPARIYWLTPWEIGYQVAWETALSPMPAPEFEELVLEAGDPNWELVAPIAEVRSPNPRSVSTAIHGDWRGFVSEEDPGVPGEFVHVYTTGLGPVQPFVETGQAAPLSQPARATPLPECSQIPSGKELPVAFAGLAPGLVGFYVLTVQIPPGHTEDQLQILCESAWVANVWPILQ